MVCRLVDDEAVSIEACRRAGGDQFVSTIVGRFV